MNNAKRIFNEIKQDFKKMNNLEFGIFAIIFYFMLFHIDTQELISLNITSLIIFLLLNLIMKIGRTK
jgi:hypothetical protein